MARKTIQAAGGIVVRGGARPRIAVVQRSKDDAWVLPRGKLERDENPAGGARREVVEETGHRVKMHEFLGAITYRARGRPKVVQFWRMQADRRPEPRRHEGHRGGRVAAACHGGAAAELSAGEAVPAPCWAPHTQAAAAQDGAAPESERAAQNRQARAAQYAASNLAAILPQLLPKFNARGGPARPFQTLHSPRIHAKNGT